MDESTHDGFPMLQQDDIHLVNRCLEGDDAAWETMVRQYGRMIRRLAHRYAGGAEEADDLAQEVFFRVYRRLDTFRAETGTLQSWLVRVGRNLMIDRFRQTCRLQRFGVHCELEGLQLQDEQALMPDRSIENTESLEFLMECLQSLAPELRQAVIMRFLNGMSYQEMTEHLGVPEGTVKSRINRARARLARLLSRRQRSTQVTVN